MVVGADAQGPEVVRPWVERAGGTYPALVDRRNALGKLLNVKYVPYVVAVDEEGRLCRGIAPVNIDDAAFRADLETWATTGAIPPAWREAGGKAAAAWSETPGGREADARYQLAVVLLGRGRREEAIAELRRAFRLDPENWIIRKQLWAVERPEAFYSGPVDYEWQKRRRQEEDAEKQ